MPEGCSLFAVIRDGVATPLRPDTVLQEGDKVIAIGREDCQAMLHDQLIGDDGGRRRGLSLAADRPPEPSAARSDRLQPPAQTLARRASGAGCDDRVQARSPTPSERMLTTRGTMSRQCHCQGSSIRPCPAKRRHRYSSHQEVRDHDAHRRAVRRRR